MNLMAILEGLTLGSALIVAIGAQNAFVLRQGLVRQHVFVVCTVCLAGDALLITLGAGGLGTILRADVLILRFTAWAGAVYLLFVAAQSFRRAAKPQALVVTARETRLGSLAKVIASALALTFLNPHVYLDTVVVLGSVAARYASGDRALFAFGAVLASAAWFYTLGFGAARLAPLFGRPGTWRIVDGGIGVLMLALSASLVHWALTTANSQ